MENEILNAGFLTLEKPQENAKYLIGIESVPCGSPTNAEFVVLVTRIQEDGIYPVALMHQKPVSLESSYRQAVEIIKIYNQFGGYNPKTRAVSVTYVANAATADHLFTYLDRNGVGGLLSDRVIMTARLKRKVEWLANLFIKAYREDLSVTGCPKEDLKDAAMVIFATYCTGLFEN